MNDRKDDRENDRENVMGAATADGRRGAARAMVAGAALAGLLGCSPPPPAATSAAELAVELVAVEPPAGPGALAPELHAGAGGGLLLTWLEGREGGGHDLRLARLAAGTWSAPRTLASGERFFANWADRPAAVETGDGTLYAHWLEKLGDGTYAYGVAYGRTPAAGEAGADPPFEPLGLLHDDVSPSEHGFVSWVPLAGGDAQAFWLDGRDLAVGAEGVRGAMALRTARVGGAASGTASGTAAAGPPPATVLDDRVCECCATAAVMTAAGPLVAYRDRSPDEVRDIAVVGSSAAGWGEPRIVAADGWTITGCPVNGPALAADGARVVLAWFTGAGDRPRVRAAFSQDAGASWGEPIEVDGGTPLGRVDAVLLPGGDALVSWLAQGDGGGEIRLRRIAAGAAAGAAAGVAGVVATSTDRGAGVPRLERVGDEVYLAWLEAAEPRRLRVARVEVR